VPLHKSSWDGPFVRWGCVTVSVTELHQAALDLGRVTAQVHAVHSRAVAVYVMGQERDSRALASLRAAFSVVLVVTDALVAVNVVQNLAAVGYLASGDSVANETGASDELVVDQLRHEARWRGNRVPLSGRERTILRCLLEPPRRVWSFRELHEWAWEGVYLGDPSLVHSALKRLRRKLRDCGVGNSIDAVRGVGFRFTG
jgi:DNA-binding response OmpR family regulator